MIRLFGRGIAGRDEGARQPGCSPRIPAPPRAYRTCLCQQAAPPIFTTAHSWHISQPLDVAAMEAGAAHLIGEHDFKSFCMAASAVGKPTCRNVSEICFSREVIMGEPQLVVRVVGNAFLHSMVRTIVGTLVLVGRGKRRADWVRDVLAARDRTAAGENAPAQGLVLWHVEY